MPSEFAPPGGKPRVTKKQIREMQENYKKAGELLQDTTAEEAQEKAILDELFEAEFDAAFEETQKVGVYIGRFQPLHKGHQNILEKMIEENDKVLVFIGTGGEEERNPFSYEVCESFFSEYISADFIVQKLQDQPQDTIWISQLAEEIDRQIIANSEIYFYGGDLAADYAIAVVKQHITNYLETPVSYKEVSRNEFLIPIHGEQITLSGTLCREAILKGDGKFLEQALPQSVYSILYSD